MLHDGQCWFVFSPGPVLRGKAHILDLQRPITTIWIIMFGSLQAPDSSKRNIVRNPILSDWVDDQNINRNIDRIRGYFWYCVDESCPLFKGSTHLVFQNAKHSDTIAYSRNPSCYYSSDLTTSIFHDLTVMRLSWYRLLSRHDHEAVIVFNERKLESTNSLETHSNEYIQGWHQLEASSEWSRHFRKQRFYIIRDVLKYSIVYSPSDLLHSIPVWLQDEEWLRDDNIEMRIHLSVFSAFQVEYDEKLNRWYITADLLSFLKYGYRRDC